MLTAMTAAKVRENLLRRMAARQGLTLQKSRRRDPMAVDFGAFGLYRGSDLVAGPDIEAVEHYLTGGRSDRLSDHRSETASPVEGKQDR